jgi:hypothetical protein
MTTRSYDDKQVQAIKAPCRVCGRVYFFTDHTDLICLACREAAQS